MNFLGSDRILRHVIIRRGTCAPAGGGGGQRTWSVRLKPRTASTAATKHLCCGCAVRRQAWFWINY